MSRILIFTFALFSLVSLAMAACSQAPGAARSVEVSDYASLVKALSTRGASVEPAGEITQDFFSPVGRIIKVNGQDVQVFEYPSPEDVADEAEEVAPDGGSIGTTMVTWVDTPHFYMRGNLIVLYVGSDAGTLSALDSALGEQFAGR